MTKYVNTYLVRQAYGGPEEGGWWYSAGEPVESIRCDEWASRLSLQAIVEDTKADRQRWCDKENAERPPAHSVNSTGVYEVCAEDSFAQPYPAERPHYE